MNDGEWWLSSVNIYYFKYQVLPHWSLHFNLKVVKSLVCYNHCKKQLYELKILTLTLNILVNVYVTTWRPITPPTGFSSTSFWSKTNHKHVRQPCQQKVLLSADANQPLATLSSANTSVGPIIFSNANSSMTERKKRAPVPIYCLSKLFSDSVVII